MRRFQDLFLRLWHREPLPIRDFDSGPGTGGELRDAEKRADFTLRRMQHAIARRDFRTARDWSFDDLKARRHLREVRGRNDVGE